MPRLPIRFMPEEFSEYVYKLLVEGPLREVEKGSRAMRKLYFVASQGGGKSWSMASTAEWLWDELEERGYSVEVRMLDVDRHLRPEYRVKNTAELIEAMKKTKADVFIGIVGEAAADLSNMVISGEEYKANIMFARSFFRARHYSNARIVYFMFASQKTKRLMGDVRDLADLVVIKALPRWEANLIIEALNITDRAVVEELMRLYDLAFIHGDKSRGVGVANDKAGLIRFDPPSRIIDPEYEAPPEDDGESAAGQPQPMLGKHKTLDRVERRCVTRNCRITIPAGWLEGIEKTNGAWFFTLERVVLEDGQLGFLLRPRVNQQKRRGLLGLLGL